MPVGLLLIISIINPGYVHPMFHTTTGLIALGIGAVMIIAGGLVIRRLVDVEI
jgi:tight adherence protein B